MSRVSSDLASATRKRALRRLANQENKAYRGFYESLRAEGFGKDAARGRAWTQLRQQFLDEYLALHAMEQVGVAAQAVVPARIRSRAWQRAISLLGELRAVPYREHFERFRAAGRSNSDAAYRAAYEIRQQEPDLFARLLADEIRMWLRAENGEGPPVAATGDFVTDFYAALDELKAAVARAARDPRFDAENVYSVLAVRVRGVIREAGLS
jgi:hypothetical protein